jgi:hypothetical protein
MSFISLFQHPTPKIRARYRVGVGIALTLLLHVLFVVGLIIKTEPDEQNNLTVSGALPPLEVSFITNKPTPKPKPQPIETPPPQSKPEVKQKPTKQDIKKTTVKPTKSATAITEKVVPQQAEMPKYPPEMDMSSMLNAARARRQAAEADAAQENAQARAAEAPKSANDIARENIAFQMNKRAGGKNGVFQILSKGPRVATYAFFGWTKDPKLGQRQVITVDAGAGGDVELAIIDSMITLIRKDYKGDFKWDSHRLGRVINLSARVADTKELQTFLMQEFFSVKP